MTQALAGAVAVAVVTLAAAGYINHAMTRIEQNIDRVTIMSHPNAAAATNLSADAAFGGPVAPATRSLPPVGTELSADHAALLGDRIQPPGATTAAAVRDEVRAAVLDETMQVAVAILIVAAMVIILLGLLVRRQAMQFRTLQALHAGALRVAAGKFDEKVAIGRGAATEIADVARVFNTMMASLRELYDQLADSTRQLELRVQERTAELECANSALAASEQASRQASDAKSQFLAMISHELRTPLNVIIGYSEMMAQQLHGEVGNRRYREYAGDINASGQHLLTLINEILDMTRVETGKLILDETGIDLRKLALGATRMVAGRAAEAGIHLDTELPVDLPHLRGDEQRLRQALINLLVNAVKFTPAGGRILLTARRDGSWVAVTVVDNGVGMSAEQLDRLGTPFYQGDNTLARKHDGMGIGLSLVKAFVEAHDGAFSIESKPGNGTRATIRLPLHRAIASGAPHLRLVASA